MTRKMTRYAIRYKWHVMKAERHARRRNRYMSKADKEWEKAIHHENAYYAEFTRLYNKATQTGTEGTTRENDSEQI